MPSGGIDDYVSSDKIRMMMNMIPKGLIMEEAMKRAVMSWASPAIAVELNWTFMPSKEIVFDCLSDIYNGIERVYASKIFEKLGQKAARDFLDSIGCFACESGFMQII